MKQKQGVRAFWQFALALVLMFMMGFLFGRVI